MTNNKKRLCNCPPVPDGTFGRDTSTQLRRCSCESHTYNRHFRYTTPLQVISVCIYEFNNLI